jgi:hypothetical protein
MTTVGGNLYPNGWEIGTPCPTYAHDSTLTRVRRIVLATVASAACLALPAPSLAQTPSFADWWGHFSARVQRDVTRIQTACEKRYGHHDAKVGACFVKAERVSLRVEHAALKKQIKVISRGQKATCKQAIQVYWQASSKAVRANLAYLDSHPHVAVTRLSRDLNRKPFTKLKSLTYAATSRAIRICG